MWKWERWVGRRIELKVIIYDECMRWVLLQWLPSHLQLNWQPQNVRQCAACVTTHHILNLGVNMFDMCI